MLFNLQDEPKLQDMPTVTMNISPMVKLLMFIILPINILWCSFLTVVALPKEMNGFKTPEICSKFTKKKNCAISVDISQDVLQKKARQMNGTLYDMVISILSISYK